jgi:hypothetical protein
MDTAQLADTPAAETLLQWFKEEWDGETQWPDIRQCRDVRARIQAVVDAERGQARAMNKIKSEALKAKHKAAAEARAVLRKVPQIRAVLQTEVDKYTWPDSLSVPWPPRDSAVLALAALARAEADLRIVSETLDDPGIHGPNPAAFIAEGVRWAWGAVVGADPSLSATEQPGMTYFVQRALRSIGMVYSDHAIIAAIKGSRSLARRHGQVAGDAQDDL